MRHRALIVLLLVAAMGACTSTPSADARPAIGTPVPDLGPSALIIFQARGGDYWFGSDGQGVYRYDGKGIVQFTTKDGLPDGRIREFQEDASGNIFITTMDGISKFDGRSFSTLTAATGEAADTAWKLRPEDLWFRSTQGQRGVFRYDGTSLHHLEFPRTARADEHYAQFPNLPYYPDEVYSIYKDGKGRLWFGTAALGICRYDGTSLDWMFEKHLTENRAGGSFGIRSIIEDQAGSFWFCNHRYRYTIFPSDATGTIRYTREDGVPDARASDGDLIYFMSIVRDGPRDLWMATYRDGAWRYDGTALIQYPLRDGAAPGGVLAYSVTKDNRGRIWVGTHNAGAFMFNGTAFERFRP